MDTFCPPAAMRLRVARAALALSLLAASAASMAGPAPVDPEGLRPYTATYSSRWNGIDLTGTRTLEALPNGHYQLRMEVSHLLMRIHESAEFTYNRGQIQPLHYRQQRDSFTGLRKLELNFDWQAAQAQSIRDSEQWQVPLRPGTFDRLSYQSDLCRALQASGGKPVHYAVIDKGRTKDYAFEQVGRERVRTAIGLFDTLKVQRQRKDPDRQTVFWVAPAHDCLLVRLQQLEDGSHYELILREATLGGTPLRGAAE